MLAVSIETQKNLFGKRCECLFRWVGGARDEGGTKGVGGGGLSRHLACSVLIILAPHLVSSDLEAV